MRAEALPIEELVEGEWNPLWRSFLRELKALNRSPWTLTSYGYSVADFYAFLVGHGRTLDLADRREMRAAVQDWIVCLLERHQPKTAHIRFGALRRWFNWLLTEGELGDPETTKSPMEGMGAPDVPEKDPDVLSKDAVRKLLGVCAGHDFLDRRDTALIRFLVDTGTRRGATAAMTTDRRDLDLDLIQSIVLSVLDDAISLHNLTRHGPPCDRVEMSRRECLLRSVHYRTGG